MYFFIVTQLNCSDTGLRKINNICYYINKPLFTNFVLIKLFSRNPNTSQANVHKPYPTFSIHALDQFKPIPYLQYTYIGPTQTYSLPLVYISWTNSNLPPTSSINALDQPKPTPYLQYKFLGPTQSYPPTFSIHALDQPKPIPYLQYTCLGPTQTYSLPLV